MNIEINTIAYDHLGTVRESYRPGGPGPSNAASWQERNIMSRYKMDGGGVVDTNNASLSWREARRYDGNNMVSQTTGSQWHHERLHRSRKGRYYIEYWNACEGGRSTADWVSHRSAAAWLILNDHDLPAELLAVGDEITE